MNRRFEVFCNDKWNECKFQDLKSGDVFRSFEQEDKILYSGKAVVFEASSNAKQLDGVWCIEIKEPTEELIRNNIHGKF
jgi:hypothetical protein